LEHNGIMEPKIQANEDGTLTISITLPAATASESMLSQEERLMDALNAVGRVGALHLLQGFDTKGEPIAYGQRKWTSKGKIAKFYETPWGEVLLERHLYQHSGGGATLCPLEEHARIIGGSATPHLARSLGHKYANNNARAVVRDLEENHARKLAPSYVSDIATAIAEAAGEPVLEQNAHETQSSPEAVKSVVLGLDGTCALFCEEGYKQCMVGTVVLYDATGERLETIYLGQAPEMGKAQFLERLDGEWRRVCQRYPKARRVGLSDGARDYEAWLAARTQWQILDFFHASGYLAGAAPAMRSRKVQRQQWLEEACHTLKHEPGAASHLGKEMAAQREAGSCTNSAAPALAAAAGYFSHNVERMNYAVFAAMNFPIGSGVTEAACKTLVKLRLCGSGMRWTRSGAQSVITLRALLLSTSRWSSLWRYLDNHGIQSK
jgi:hypothetical protein